MGYVRRFCGAGSPSRRRHLHGSVDERSATFELNLTISLCVQRLAQALWCDNNKQRNCLRTFCFSGDMTRPKAQKNRSRATTAADGGGSAPAGHQQHAAAQQQQYGAGRRRPDGVAQPSAGAAAAAAELPEVDELERKRMQVAEELRLVEKQASIG